VGSGDEEVKPYREKWEKQLLEISVARNEACAIFNEDSSKAAAMGEIRMAVVVMCNVKIDKMTSAVNAMQAQYDASLSAEVQRRQVFIPPSTATHINVGGRFAPAGLGQETVVSARGIGLTWPNSQDIMGSRTAGCLAKKERCSVEGCPRPQGHTVWECPRLWAQKLGRPMPGHDMEGARLGGTFVEFQGGTILSKSVQDMWLSETGLYGQGLFQPRDNCKVVVNETTTTGKQ